MAMGEQTSASPGSHVATTTATLSREVTGSDGNQQRFTGVVLIHGLGGIPRNSMLQQVLNALSYWFNHEAGRWVWKQPKTRRSRRQIALAASTIAILRAHQAAQEEQRLRMDSAWEDNELVFCTRHGRPLAARNIYRAFHSLLEKGSIRRVRFHDLRHTAATLLLASRVNPKVV